MSPFTPTPAKKYGFQELRFSDIMCILRLPGRLPIFHTQHLEGHRGQGTSIPPRLLIVHPEQSSYRLLLPSCYSLTSISQISITFSFLSIQKTKQKDESERL